MYIGEVKPPMAIGNGVAVVKVPALPGIGIIHLPGMETGKGPIVIQGTMYTLIITVRQR